MSHPRVENHLRNIREELGMTQEQLAKIVGVSRQSIISIERGRFIPSIETALRLSSALKVPVDQLFWLKDESR
jgi:DNA-binding XRE family transcriptional regulator